MDADVVFIVIGIGIAGIGCAALAARQWRDGRRSLPLALLLGTVLVAGLCYVIAQGTPGFLGGHGWILAAMGVMTGPGLGLLIGAIFGAVRESCAPRSPKPAPSQKATAP